MGAGRGARPASHTAYFVAMGGVLVLLVLVLAYFFYFCIKRTKQLWSQPLPEPVKSVRPPPLPPSAYPVQPVVRESATAMARLCKQLPPSHTDTVFPTLSPNKATMLPTPGHSPARSPGRGNSPARGRSPVNVHSPGRVRSPVNVHSPGRNVPGVVVTRSPGSWPMPLPRPTIIPQSPAGKQRPHSMPDQPTPAISVADVK